MFTAEKIIFFMKISDKVSKAPCNFNSEVVTPGSWKQQEVDVTTAASSININNFEKFNCSHEMSATSYVVTSDPAPSQQHGW